MVLPQLAAWRVESLRYTVFFNEALSFAGGNWWKQVTGQEPEAILRRQQSAEYVESGSYLDGQLEFKAAFNRVDWILNFPLAGMPNSPSPEELSILTSKFSRALEVWFASLESNVLRIAYGLVGFTKIEDVSVGNSLVADYLPFMNFENAGSVIDLQIQANMPCKSIILNDMDLNLLSKWGVMNHQLVMLNPSGVPSVQTDNVVRAELDISTSASNATVFQPGNPSVISQELMGHALRILESGY